MIIFIQTLSYDRYLIFYLNIVDTKVLEIHVHFATSMSSFLFEITTF